MAIAAADLEAGNFGRTVARAQGADPDSAKLQEVDWPAYGNHARDAIGKGKPVDPVENFLPRPEHDEAPSAGTSSSGSTGGGFSVPSTSATGNTVRKLGLAVVVGLVVLEVGSMLTGQPFVINLPATSRAPSGKQKYLTYDQVVQLHAGGAA